MFVNQAAHGVEQQIFRYRDCELSADSVFAEVKVNIYSINNHSNHSNTDFKYPCDRIEPCHSAMKVFLLLSMRTPNGRNEQ